MPPQDRFDRLESQAPLPDDVKSALAKITRFQALEIGAAAKAAPAAPAAPAPRGEGNVGAPDTLPIAPADGQNAIGKEACVHCGQLNETGRETCWACYRFVRVKAPPPKTLREPDDITLVLDGVTYTSSQPDLPDDIRELMARIRKNGYSQQLLADWRSWRSTRRSPPPPSRPFEPQQDAGTDEARDIKVFRGQRVSVIRIDGKVYTSDDPALTPELKMLFQYIDAHGVTPALMDHLRQLGQVKLRPPTTAYPSDGDVAFWQSVQHADAQRELDGARQRFSEARQRLVYTGLTFGFFVLYILAHVFLR